MRLVYYTRPNFLDVALPLAQALARRIEVHLLLEVAPESWRSSMFDLDPRRLTPGPQPAEPLLQHAFPEAVRDYWRQCASFFVVAHAHARSLDLATLRVGAQVGGHIRAIAPDVVHLDDVTLRTLGLLPSLWTQTIFINVHDPEPHSGEETWRSRVARALTYRFARHFVLHNAAQREAFEHRAHVPPDRVSVIHLTPYTVYRAWRADVEPTSTAPTVLFFGRLSSYKGIDTLFEAARRVAEVVANVRFVVAGQAVGGYTLPPAPLLGNGGHIEVLDTYIPNATLARLFESASVVVCPYVDATQSGVVLTAYAFGTPVVATTVGGLPEYVRDGESGLLVPARDPGALAQALTQVLQDAGLRQHLRDGVRALSTGDLSPEQAAEKLIEAYQAHAPNSSERRRGR